MIYLLLAVLSSVAVAHTLKYAEKNLLPMYGVFTVNYFIGSVIAIIGGGGQLPPSLSWELGGLGVLMGGLFIGCFVLFSSSIARLGVSIAVSLMRLAAVLPTLGSLVFFDTLPRPLQVAGIVLAFAILPLANKKGVRMRDVKDLLSTGFGWGVLLFFGFGLTEFLFKIQKELYPVENSYQFLTLIFPIAFLIGVGMMMKTGQRLNGKVLLWGAILGTVNLFSAYFFILALKELPGVFVYPTNGIAVILLTTATGIYLWKERLTTRAIIFIILASCALTFIYQ